ncbi:hypothetical protein AQUCO_01100120v1 [Aquilegia coerulea]|uniref:Uncharacterized protein n=1 Tax=Aquilegia coerulea TaxID=218851 RepID=A0A2G5E5N2_AQUCA|nr:hypothetical protein AQUCO_01100120v1 [Aquilegia coerulea]
MDSGRKRKGSSFMKGKLVMFYRTAEKPTSSVQYNTSKVKPSPPPSTTTVGYLVDQEFLVPASNKKVSFVKSSDHGTRDTKGYGTYGGGAGDDLVDIKAASYISYVQERSGLNELIQKEGITRMFNIDCC